MAEPQTIDQNPESQRVQIFRDLEAVQKRPGMYIGSTDREGVRRCVKELVENCVDEHMAGYGDLIETTIHPDNTVTVRDYARGLPVYMHPEEGVSAAEVIMTKLHAGCKFDGTTYKVSGGLHGVGASVVNALAEWLEMEIHRDGKIYRQMYHLGVPDAPLQEVGVAEDTGTQITFKPSSQFFSELELEYDVLARWLRELAFLNPGLGLSLRDEREDRKDFYRYEGGLKAFVEHLNRNKNVINQDIVYFKEEREGIYVEGAMQWHDGYQENVYCFTNNILQKDGGTHLAGMRGGMTRTITKYLENEGLTKKFKMNIAGEDMREGLTAIIAVKVSEPRFSSQTKEKLVSTEVRPVVEAIVSERLEEFLLEKPSQAKALVGKMIDATRAREAARKAREIARKQSGLEISSLPGRFAPCQLNDPSRIEMIIVEGDSAGGSAKQARDRKFQAILPLKGKILNVEKARFDRMLASEEVGTLITALGCGIGPEEYNPDKCRFHRIILMTDADVDGAHIRTLLLTFFYRQMRELIERGYIYIAQPPLYKVKKGKKEQYVKDDAALEAYLIDTALEEAQLTVNDSNVQWEGEALRELLHEFRRVKSAIHRLGRRHPEHILFTLLRVQPISQADLHDQKKVQAWAEAIENVLNQINTKAIITKAEVVPDEGHGGFLPKFSVIDHGLANDHPFSYEFFGTKDYRIIVEFAEKISELTRNTGIVQRSGKIKHASDFAMIEQWLMDEARKGQSIQRYKGLGEMNPGQLWETTMDPNTRRMSQVSIADALAADEIFTTLMGDHVEPRADFIKTNALQVENLDI